MKKEFDYYIYVDYSEDFIGYNIIGKENVKSLLRATINFRHFKNLRHKKTYLLKIKKLLKSSNINSLIYKEKISKIYENLIIFADIIDFIRDNGDCIIFLYVDNRQYKTFMKFFNLINENKIEIVKESLLNKNSSEYKLSLIIDTQLNLFRRSNK